MTVEGTPNEPIAIVGSACRFAGDASSPSKLWDILRDPTALAQEIADSRFSSKGFYHPDSSYHGHSNVTRAYLINEDLGNFDAEFFGIKSVEAKAMDPQQRFLMEVVYEGLESAGMPIAHLRGSDAAVYVGVMFNDYGTMLLRDYQDVPTYYATGTGQSILSNRISYFFDWHGASITVDTACSSSLVALHMAIQALRAGDSRMALACGSNLIIGPENFIIESKLKMLSPDGLSRMWDQDANGYARGDGVAAIVLKTLSAAIEDGDHIECIIRETGLNQDGASAGITMPSASAQEALIRSTYAKAGLDLDAKSDRPQYFEAHGTGTPAGDPTEAEAIYNAFNANSAHDPLYVGSIKTVLGHTEGTAGVAAILKASLALQNGYIPPNLLFNVLSNSVAPFYKNVEILRKVKQWPSTEDGIRRASVNSFGFGGANAHAILETYQTDNTLTRHSELLSTALFTPFVFSAPSERSLRANLSAYADVLGTNLSTDQKINLQDLAWTLRERRSVFPYRVTFTASSTKDLQTKIIAKLQEENASIGVKALPLSKRTSNILGIFTGQGAQYARMGAELIEKSETGRRIVQQLETDLAQLEPRPTWSLQAEILASNSSSRLSEAAISQPLCTAVQIILVDLLKLAGVHFAAVVGHSSGEIAAAYAGGYITARDAMCIAYYRGLHLASASSPNGSHIKGAMLAVGSSVEEVKELCEDDSFLGRVTIAAANSDSSVTISGDEDAIEQLQVILDDEKKFNRRLRVDQAYHSNHMLPCFDIYVESLHKCGIKPLQKEGCTWYSSVYNRAIVEKDMDILGGKYWAENMTKTVLFSQTLESALSTEPAGYDIVLEVGPHPALKGPTTQTIQRVLEREIPYHGLLARGTDAVEATSTALGFLWSYLDNKSGVDLDAYQTAMMSTIAGKERHKFSVVKGLPTYQWNHESKYWHESRSSRKLRLRREPVHSLLGDITPDSAPHHMSWKNLLRVREMEWLTGHQVQGQVVFPAAGYITTALEASRFLAAASAGGIAGGIHLIELQNFVIHQAIVLDQSPDTGIEVFIQMSEITKDQNHIRARYTYSAALDAQSNDLTLAASGDLEIILGESSPYLLPIRKPDLPHMIDVEPERFYSALADLGYNFSGRFRSLSALRRRYNKSTCQVMMQPQELEEAGGGQPLLIHPAELDAVLQSIILAYSYPYDEQLRTMHLPTSIRRIRVNPAALGRPDETYFLPVDASISPKHAGERGISGHVDLYSNQNGDDGRGHTAIQIQGATFMPLGGSAAEQDRRVFSRVHWIESRPDGILAARDIELSTRHIDTVRLLERVATFYLRKFNREVAADHPMRSKFTTKWYLNYARHISEMVEDGRHKWSQKEWLNDTLDDVLKASSDERFAGIPDLEIMHLVGKHMPRVFKGETTMLEEFRANDILDRYYANGFGLKESAQWLSRTAKQIVDRYPHMNILEIGAGTGGATKAIFREIGQSFLSYTYTDISAAFFENASNVFAQQRDRMIFKTFNAENSPIEQGFKEGAYDLVVCFFVIHATSNLDTALRNIRKLLKPGGYLVVGEGQEGENDIASSGFIFGTLPGWWLGTGTGRTLSPHVSPKKWDDLLRATGFSGVDAHPPHAFEDILNVFHFVSQAVDDQVNFFRDPLSLLSSNTTSTNLPTTLWRGIPPIKQLVIVGGNTIRSSHFVHGIQSIFHRNFPATEIHSFKTLTDVDYDIVGDQDNNESPLVISFVELDNPLFKDITPSTFESLKKMFGSGKTLLWVSSGRRDDEPISNMIVGFGRTATNEIPELRLQHLDIADLQGTSPQTVAEVLLRFHVRPTNIDNDIVWTVEPEIVIDNEKRQLLSRLRPIPELNDRYNSSRRVIVREKVLFESKDLAPLPISVQLSPNDCIIRELSRYSDITSTDSKQAEELIELNIMHTVSSAVKSPLGHKFLVLGVQSGTKVPFLALTSSLSSIVKVPVRSAVCYQAGTQGFSYQDLLATAASHLVAMAVLDPLHSGETLLAHNPTQTLARALAIQGAAKGVHIVCATDSSSDGGNKEFTDSSSWIKLPGYLNPAELHEILLSGQVKPSSFVGFSDNESQRSENEATMISLLASQNACHIETAKTVYSYVGSGDKADPDAQLGERLRSVLNFIQQQEPTQQSLISRAVHLDSLVRGEVRPSNIDPLSIIDWVTPSQDTVSTSTLPTLPVHITRLDGSGPVFKGNATYWIVGMSGALGISLADWMISNGARYIAVTTRNPRIAPEWIASHKRRGATVVVLPCDVTNETGLRAVHQKICSTFPPIAGAMNGAMVLRDVSIRNMSFSQLTDVISPKVYGSIHLDQIFRNVDLDFFVLISSINCVIGNWGQANYAAANTFMSSLAAQRRKRGLRAAVVNAGAIIGAGYMERESRRALDLIVQRLYMMRLSEEDWNQAICEAIDASRLDSPHGPELTTGLSDVPFNTPNAPEWFLNPKFSSFVVHQKGSKAEEDKDEAAGASLQELLQHCRSQQDLYKIITHAFASQLRNVLQMTMSDEDLMAARSNEIGLDSLVSVDIRTWFHTNLQVSVPVLKIISNEPIAYLVQHAVETIPPELVPEMSGSSSDRQEPTSSGNTSSPTNGTESDPSAADMTSPASTPSPAPYIDWEAESRPAAEIASFIPRNPSSPVPVSPPKVVVLTGVSGLFGHHLLDYLLTHTAAQEIHCLAIRRLASRLASHELREDPRVVYHEGDLSDPLLGLSSSQAAAALFAKVDLVIHNGADTSHMKYYPQLRASNVDSTVTLTRWCLPRRIPFHYVSSAGVATLYNKHAETGGFPEISITGPESSPPAADGSFGYMSSKVTNERFLERVCAWYSDWRVCIHRPSTIIREGADAATSKAQLDWVNALITYSRQIQAVPRVQHNRGALDLVKVQSACEDVLKHISLDDKVKGVTYVHNVGDVVIPMDQLQDIGTEEGANDTLAVIPMSEWTEKAVEAGLHPVVANLIEMMDVANDYPKLLKSRS
ncbi:putative polyketide synthase [Xylogone sp. PMI_703]|nr:putative polyketide synthase [Xylogone sp. PMI_703]